MDNDTKQKTDNLKTKFNELKAAHDDLEQRHSALCQNDNEIHLSHATRLASLELDIKHIESELSIIHNKLDFVYHAIIDLTSLAKQSNIVVGPGTIDTNDCCISKPNDLKPYCKCSYCDEE